MLRLTMLEMSEKDKKSPINPINISTKTGYLLKQITYLTSPKIAEPRGVNFNYYLRCSITNEFQKSEKYSQNYRQI